MNGREALHVIHALLFDLFGVGFAVGLLFAVFLVLCCWLWWRLSQRLNGGV